MKKLLFGRVLSCTIFVLKQRALHSTSKQLTGKKGFVALRFFRKNFTWPIATFTWSIIPFICTNFTLSHYYPPPASGITTFSRTTRLNLCFSQPFILVEFRCRPNMGQYILFAEQVSHFIYCWALSFEIECPVSQLKCVHSGVSKVKH